MLAVLGDSIALGRADEQDLFVTRALLQVLAAATPATAQKRIQAAKSLKQHVKCKGSPLENFCCLLLTAVDKQSAALFDVACSEYGTALSRDPSFDDMLERIASVYLGRGGSGGGLGALLGSLFGG